MLIPCELLELHRIASKDEERPTLRYVHAERDEEAPHLTVSDGFRLVTATWSEPEVEEVPADYGDLTPVAGFTSELLAESCAEIARVIPKGDVPPIYRHAWLEETTGGGIVRLGAGEKAFGQSVQCESKDPDIDFPDWRTVIDGVKAGTKVGVDAQALAELLKVLSKASGEAGVVLYVPSDPTAPIGVHVDSRDGRLHLDAVIMPMTLDLTGRPDWETVPTVPGTPEPVKPTKEVEPQMDLGSDGVAQP